VRVRVGDISRPILLTFATEWYWYMCTTYGLPVTRLRRHRTLAR